MEETLTMRVLNGDIVRREFEETAVIGCRVVREFLTRRTKDKLSLHRAKAGAVAMASYARLRGTMANEEALRLAAEKTGAAPLKRIEGRRLRRVS